MAPPSKWDEEDDSTPPSSPPTAAVIARRSKFEDEDEDSDVVDSWDAADDSEAEREKEKKATALKAKAEAEAAANKKSKVQRIKEISQRRKIEEEEDEETSSDEDDAEKRERLRKTEQESDLRHAEDLFGDVGIKNRSSAKALVITDASDPTSSIDLSSLALFNPSGKDQFQKLRETLVPLLASNAKKGPYLLFMQEFTKQIVHDLPSGEIKKIASGLTTLSNEKMKEEKAAEKGGKKTKAAKNKATLAAVRDVSTKADTTAYDDLEDGDDFM